MQICNDTYMIIYNMQRILYYVNMLFTLGYVFHVTVIHNSYVNTMYVIILVYVSISTHT